MKGQIKKASSAGTPKASHLTVIPSTGNRPMNNSTAVNLNNQAWTVVYEAEMLANKVTSSVCAINSIKNILDINRVNQDDGEDTLHTSVVEGLLVAVNVITDSLKDSIDTLNKALAKEGFNHE